VRGTLPGNAHQLAAQAQQWLVWVAPDVQFWWSQCVAVWTPRSLSDAVKST
jgi:hypothetical protein